MIGTDCGSEMEMPGVTWFLYSYSGSLGPVPGKWDSDCSQHGAVMLVIYSFFCIAERKKRAANEMRAFPLRHDPYGWDAWKYHQGTNRPGTTKHVTHPQGFDLRTLKGTPWTGFLGHVDADFLVQKPLNLDNRFPSSHCRDICHQHWSWERIAIKVSLDRLVFVSRSDLEAEGEARLILISLTVIVKIRVVSYQIR